MLYCSLCGKQNFKDTCPKCGCVRSETEDQRNVYAQYVKTGNTAFLKREFKPKEYRKRLASFVGKEQSEVMKDEICKSKMPFELFIRLGVKTRVKSTRVIRGVLERISNLIAS